MINFIDEEYFKDVEIAFYEEIQYNFSDDINICYDLDTKEFYALRMSDEIDEDIIIIESEDYPMEEDKITLWEEDLTKEKWLEIKKFILDHTNQE